MWNALVADVGEFVSVISREASSVLQEVSELNQEDEDDNEFDSYNNSTKRHDHDSESESTNSKFVISKSMFLNDEEDSQFYAFAQKFELESRRKEIQEILESQSYVNSLHMEIVGFPNPSPRSKSIQTIMKNENSENQRNSDDENDDNDNEKALGERRSIESDFIYPQENNNNQTNVTEHYFWSKFFYERGKFRRQKLAEESLPREELGWEDDVESSSRESHVDQKYDGQLKSQLQLQLKQTNSDQISVDNDHNTFFDNECETIQSRSNISTSKTEVESLNLKLLKENNELRERNKVLEAEAKHSQELTAKIGFLEQRIVELDLEIERLIERLHLAKFNNDKITENERGHSSIEFLPIKEEEEEEEEEADDEDEDAANAEKSSNSDYKSSEGPSIVKEFEKSETMMSESDQDFNEDSETINFFVRSVSGQSQNGVISASASSSHLQEEYIKVETGSNAQTSEMQANEEEEEGWEDWE